LAETNSRIYYVYPAYNPVSGGLKGQAEAPYLIDFMLRMACMKEESSNSNSRRRFGLFLPAYQAGATENASVAAWLIRLRWVAIAAQLAAGIIGFNYIFLEPLLVYPYIGTVFFLWLFNCYSVVSLRSNPAPGDSTIFLQVAVDTAALSFLLALSGGTKNPFVALLFIHATLGALLLRANYRGWFVVLILGCLLGVFGARNWQVLSSDIYVWEFMPLFALFVSLFISWGLVASLSDTLQVTRSNLSRARAREDRINHLLALGALTAEFAHQFATPLNTLRMRLARLRRQNTLGDNTDLKAISDTLDQSENILKEMTTAPLDSTMLLFEEVSLFACVSEAVKQWRSNNPQVEVAFQSTVKSNGVCRIPSKVFARSLFNLLDNAAFSASAQRIELEVSEDAERLFLSVMDRGPGWPIELTEKGIRPHFTTRPGGTGLGLFNCQSLCEVMGGSLELLDRKGGGAIAKLALPKTA